MFSCFQSIPAVKVSRWCPYIPYQVFLLPRKLKFFDTQVYRVWYILLLVSDSMSIMSIHTMHLTLCPSPSAKFSSHIGSWIFVKICLISYRCNVHKLTYLHLFLSVFISVWGISTEYILLYKLKRWVITLWICFKRKYLERFVVCVLSLISMCGPAGWSKVKHSKLAT